MHPFFITTNSDARNIPIADRTVQTIVLSPPYWGLRIYLDDVREIGREDDLRQWIDNLVLCGREWRRVLRDDGTLWINCGDSYTSRGGNYCNGSQGKTSRVGASSPESCPVDGRSARNSSIGIGPKNLIGLPWRLAFSLQADGWYLRSAIFWAKGIDWTDAEREAQQVIIDAIDLVRFHAEGTLFGLDKSLDAALKKATQAVDRLAMSGAVMPESVSDRPTQAYEMLFLFSKSERYYYDAGAIRVPQSSNTNSRGCGETPKGAIADRGLDRANNSFQLSIRNKVVPGGRNARNVWRIPTGQSPSGGYVLPDGRVVNHPASFPRALAARCILAGTSRHGACAKCGSPFIAQALSGEWFPTCTCFGDPVPVGKNCSKCNGSAKKHVYPRVQEHTKAHALPGHTRRTQQDGRDSAKPRPTDEPCPHCLCSTCKGTGKEIASAPRRDEYIPTDGRRDSGKRGVIGGLGANSMIETGEPCQTCGGFGSTGRVMVESWDADTLDEWSRAPCLVLDPMAGTGQTGMAALDLGRSVVLNDLHPGYCDLMAARLNAWPRDLGGRLGTKAE